MKLNNKRTILIGLAFMSICSFWQIYDNIIPLILQNSFGLGETLTGVLMAMDNILAIVMLPIFGTISDKVDTRWGKRTPFIVCGTFLAVLFTVLLPIADNARNFVLFVVSLFAVLVSMGLYRSPAVALMPDLTPNRLRSKANAIINLMGAVGGVYALVMIKLLVGKGETPNYLPLFLSLILVMVLAVLLLLIAVPEKKTYAKVMEEVTAYEKANGLPEGSEAPGAGDADLDPSGDGKLPADVKRSMLFLLASIFLWFTAYNAVTTAFSRYTKVVWQMEGGSFANCLMVATITAIFSYIPIGIISSKVGRKKTILGGIVLMSLCYLLAVFCTEFHPLLFVAFGVLGIGWAAISVNSYPMIVEMGKGSDIGKYTGTYYTFSMAAQIMTPVLSGFLLEYVSYRTLFPYAVFFSCAAFLTMSQVRHGDTKPEVKKDALEYLDVDD